MAARGSVPEEGVEPERQVGPISDPPPPTTADTLPPTTTNVAAREGDSSLGKRPAPETANVLRNIFQARRLAVVSSPSSSLRVSTSQAVEPEGGFQPLRTEVDTALTADEAEDPSSPLSDMRTIREIVDDAAAQRQPPPPQDPGTSIQKSAPQEAPSMPTSQPREIPILTSEDGEVLTVLESMRVASEVSRWKSFTPLARKRHVGSLLSQVRPLNSFYFFRKASSTTSDLFVLFWQLYQAYISAEEAVQTDVDAAVAGIRLENVRLVGELEGTKLEHKKLHDEIAALKAQLEKESSESLGRLRRQQDAVSILEAEVAEKAGKMAEMSEAIRILGDSRQDYHDRLMTVVREREIATGQRNSLRRENEELASQVSMLTAEVAAGRTALKTAVKDYQTSPDFTAACVDSFARGAYWMSQRLSTDLPGASESIKAQSAQLMKAGFPHFSPDVDDDGPPPADGAAP